MNEMECIAVLNKLLQEAKSYISEINLELGQPNDFRSDFQSGYLYGLKVAIQTLISEKEWKKNENA